MRQVRCFVDVVLHSGAELELPDTATGHLLRVLRMGDGDPVTLFNGDGFDYPARLRRQGRACRALVGERQPVELESGLMVTLAQGIARGEKMDLILQKATELGVQAFWPLLSERTEVKLDAERSSKRLRHWHAVIASACEQCGRARFPALATPRSLDSLLQESGTGALRLILDPQGDFSVNSLPAIPAEGILIAIGPEGGFSPGERSRLLQHGFLGLRLGPRILRTETAGLAALAALQSRFGDLA